MNPLFKFFLAVLLLTVASASWAACPEGTKQTYKGCEAIKEKVTEEQQEVKEVTAEILELHGFVSEEIQIGVVTSDTVEMTVSAPKKKPVKRQRDFSIDLGREAAIDVSYSVYGEDSDVFTKNNLLLITFNAGGGFGVPVKFDRVRVLVGSEKSHDPLNPDYLRMEIYRSDFASIRDSSGCSKMWMDKGSSWRFEFLNPKHQRSNNCRFKMLTKEEQEKLWLLANNIDRIVEVADTQVPKGADPNYWLNLAEIIRTNAPESLYR